MKAILFERYGQPELREVDEPEVADNEVLVRVHASSVNAADWYAMAGRPYFARLMGNGLRKPKKKRFGTDFAGRVEAVGSAVTEWKPGDEVFGVKAGAYAEYIAVAEDRLVAKPANVSFEEAAAAPVAATTALQALRDKGNLQPGQRVLINGASGGVGTYTVQIAKVLGAEVAGVCSTANAGLAGSLGADRVTDYTCEDFTKDERRYDLMIDIAGSRPFSAFRRVLQPNATVVVVGGPKKNRLLGPLAHVVKTRLASIGKGQKVVFFIAKITKEDTTFLADLLESGKMTSVLDDRRFALSEVPEALRYFHEGHVRGKVAITV